MSYYERKPVIKFDLEFSLKEINSIVSQTGSVIIETYPGVRINELIKQLKNNGYDGEIINTNNYTTHNSKEFRKAILEDLTEDRVFGRFTNKIYENYFDHHKINNKVKQIEKTNYIVIGICAHLFENNSIIYYMDLTRWQIQLRYRESEGIYFGSDNEGDKLRNFKRGYFIEWRMADKIKKKIWEKIDYFIENETNNLKIISAPLLKKLIYDTSIRPFRLTPYFDAGVWGGKWMKNHFNLGENKYSRWAWGFDGVPEENSVIFGDNNGEKYEIPAINIVFMEPKNLLGSAVWNRFGEEFPIRFDFLDTIGGENLSLQVHPTTQYIKDHFNATYAQEESYYILDVDQKQKPFCYLGLKTGIDYDQLINNLRNSQKTGKFDADKYINKFPVKKHDHFLHPAGVIHTSGKGCMVLEISSTPYIFTFKLWDWGRLGLDGKPRPINIEHGKNVIQQDYDTKKTTNELVNRFSILKNNISYKEEKTGLHPTQFIETRRFTINDGKSVIIKNHNSVNMLNLVDGEQAIVEAINDEFKPLVINYAETFIVPESCKQYRIRSVTKEKIMILQAFVRV